MSNIFFENLNEHQNLKGKSKKAEHQILREKIEKAEHQFFNQHFKKAAGILFPEKCMTPDDNIKNFLNI